MNVAHCWPDSKGNTTPLCTREPLSDSRRPAPRPKACGGHSGCLVMSHTIPGRRHFLHRPECDAPIRSTRYRSAGLVEQRSGLFPSLSCQATGWA